MAEYIERETIKKQMNAMCRKCDARFDEKECGRCGMELAREIVRSASAADVVEVNVLKAWLYELAMNNTDNYLCTACEEIISRLDGLRVFAKERRETK